MNCIFCQKSKTTENDVYSILDAYAVTNGHTLVIPKEHIATWFDASDELKNKLMKQVDEVKKQLDEQYNPDGYNIGMNCGEAAGQTVPHLHIHVIPRYKGDMEDPRGGVRHVIPEKGNYLK